MPITDCCCSSSTNTSTSGANQGSETFDDSATLLSPLNVLAATVTDIPNNGLGAGTTLAYSPTSTTQIFNTTTNVFDFSSLTLGSLVDIQLDIDVITTLPNQLIDIDLVVDLGGTNYVIKFARELLATVGTHNITRYRGLCIDSNGKKNNPAKFTILSPALSSIKVNRIFCKILKR